MTAGPHDQSEPSAFQRGLRAVSGFGGKLAVATIALGLLVIGLGWNGAAGRGGQVAVKDATTGTVSYISDTRAQLPYLLSGGFLGLGLIVIGSTLLVTQSQRADRARLESKLDEVVDALGGTGLRASAPAPKDVSGLVAAGTTSYHRPDCRLVDGREEVNYLTPAEAAADGLNPCRICNPERAAV
jgi:hypothetical protein